MDLDNTPVPFFAARLVIGFLQNKLSEAERDQLDVWICETDENLSLFEELIAGYGESVFDPSKVIIETEELTELYVMTGLMARYRLDEIDTIEKEYLMSWVAASARNELLFISMKKPDFFHEFLSWLKLRLHRRVDLDK
jgi:hypothetical protein